MKMTSLATFTAISIAAVASSQAASIVFTESFNTVQTGNINTSYPHITETGALFGGVGVEDGGAATPGTGRLWAFFQTGNVGSADAAITIDLGSAALLADGATINFSFDLGSKASGQQFDENVVVRFLDGAGGTQVGSTFTVAGPNYIGGIDAVSSSITLAADTTNNLFMEITFDAGTNTAFHQGLLDEVTVTQVTAVPEPSSTALLGLGGLALILRRRK